MPPYIGQAVAAQSTKPAMTATVAIKARPNHVDVVPGRVGVSLSAALLSASSGRCIVDSFAQCSKAIASASTHACAK